ncbi:indole-3-glycerol phosphate synthase [Hasllibacter halocynthiae]|uniref:Indole-3-glycerol phosphate synthase n=1 Tax=Hasllibacter halocynthiae TaxID=595589 RepID=A0A2T0X7Z8_9RHOB|nr:indole-3-glycerol phosphate synthase TrpC [Hasllibacter halocynthiae]PRY95059.1 indole-3-glycerol phosphate synthase [Hasllibacter halocynthiae]
MNILDRIKAYKLEEVAQRRREVPEAEMERRAEAAPPVRDFAGALAAKARGGFALIAEIKKASPSKGLIRRDFDPAAHARAYAEGGAACLSVLTDGPSFQGHESFLIESRSATNLPVIRKDFLYAPYQVAEARSIGSDAILIIMATVSDAQAAELEDAARLHGMAALIEVHDEAELDRALALDSPLIGVNNRDLKTFEVDLQVTERLAARLPAGRDLVAESGLSQPADLLRLSRSGARRFLIGESLMRRPDIAAATRRILSAERKAA